MEQQQKAVHYEIAHNTLDMLGVPRRDEQEQVLTVAGRIEWMKDNLRDLEEQIANAVNYPRVKW